jgi:hypothetical protein
MALMKPDSSPRAMLIGDVVGSRRTADRSGLHRTVMAALGQVADGAIDPPKFTVGDEFQGSYPTAGAAIDAALLCRDHLLGSLSDRSLRILKGLMNDQTKKELAAAEGISPSAVSQRASRDGLDLIVLASQYLRSVP